jgi:hypothetical protein
MQSILILLNIDIYNLPRLNPGHLLLNILHVEAIINFKKY